MAMGKKNDQRDLNTYLMASTWPHISATTTQHTMTAATITPQYTNNHYIPSTTASKTTAAIHSAKTMKSSAAFAAAAAIAQHHNGGTYGFGNGNMFSIAVPHPRA